MFLYENQNIHKSQKTKPVQILRLNILSQQKKFITLPELLTCLLFIIPSCSQGINHYNWLHLTLYLKSKLLANSIVLTINLLLKSNKDEFDINYDSLFGNMFIKDERNVKHNIVNSVKLLSYPHKLILLCNTKVNMFAESYRIHLIISYCNNISIYKLACNLSFQYNMIIVIALLPNSQTVAICK